MTTENFQQDRQGQWKKLCATLSAQPAESSKARAAAKNILRLFSTRMNIKCEGKKMLHELARTRPFIFEYIIRKEEDALELGKVKDDKGRTAFEYHIAHLEDAEQIRAQKWLYAKSAEGKAAISLSWVNAMEIATEDGVRKSIMFAEYWKQYGRVATLHPQWVEDTPEKRLAAIDTKAGKGMILLLCDKVGLEQRGIKGSWRHEYWSPSIAQWLPKDGCVKKAPFLSEWNLLNEINKVCSNSKGYRGYEYSNEFRLDVGELTKIFEFFVMQSLGDGLDWNAKLRSRATQIQRTEDPTSWGLKKAADGVPQLKWLESKIGNLAELARKVEHEFLIKSCDIVKPNASAKRNAL